MKCFSMLLVTIILTINSVFGQVTDEKKNELYPQKYTFEKAEDFQVKGEYDKAIWFYINLFPDNKIQVAETVKAIEIKLDTIDMSIFIKSSFARYATFDPSITSFKGGVPNMDFKKLKLKGAWGDELIQKYLIQINIYLQRANIIFVVLTK